ncbi:MAG: FAD-binding oxidoreductase [Burkholderiaceae bacterium]
MVSAAFLEAAHALLGPRGLLTDPNDQAPHLTDWRGRFTGRALAVAFPDTTEAVAALVKLAAHHRVPIVPQGGNTGLSGGATPDDSGQQLVLCLTRLNRIRSQDPANKTLIAEAGVSLQAIQEAAQAMGLMFPLDLTARGTATIGGNLATNAGGTAVLRYGNARQLCLGLEVVTAQGEIWNGLRGLRKDNTGYDLRDLFIGSEGTLGIITAASLALWPQPAHTQTALVSLEGAGAAVALLQAAQASTQASLTAFEFMSPTATAPVAQYFPELAAPLRMGKSHMALVLLEATEGLEETLAQAIEQGLVADAALAQSLAQAQSFWALREHITLAAAEDGPQIKLDISLPISCIPDFCQDMSRALEGALPGVRCSNFGHLGDGNLHFNLAAPLAWAEGLSRAERHQRFKAFVNEHEDRLRRIVHDAVMAREGSISAEHGLGQLRRDEAAVYKSSTEQDLMRRIKQALDPEGLLNPGKVLSTRPAIH